MHLEFDAFDLAPRQRMLIAQLYAAVDRRMDHHTARKRLVAILGDLIVTSKIFRDGGIVPRRTEHAGPAARRFDPLAGAGEIPGRQQRRGEPVLRRASRVKTLGHRAEHFAQSYRLRSRQPQGPNHLLLGKMQQLAGRCCCAKRAHRPGNVPAHVIVCGIDRVADPAFHLGAQHQCVQEFVPGDRRAILRQGKDR